MTAPRSFLRRVLAWPVDSQLTARRNALVASTELAQRRKERIEVEEFLESLGGRRRRVVAAAAVQHPHSALG